jgi:CO/xanthine dehydrogenase Mo-binding subunit
VALTADGRVQVRTGKVEIGQGLHTALAQIAADALGVPIDRVDILPVSTDDCPDEGVTSGSLSIQDGGRALREACALLPSAGGPHAPASVPATAVPVVGQSVPNRSLPAKFAGASAFIHDLQPPGLLHGRVLHPPHPGDGLLAWDAEPALALPGVLRVLRDGSLLGVLAGTSAQADAGLAALTATVRWGAAALAADHEPEAALDLLALPALTRVVVDVGHPLPAASTLRARYTKPWIAHASLAPSCALACWDTGRLVVWTHSQGIFNLRRDLALAFHLEPAAVTVHHAEGAGCYGHNGADDAAYDAAWLARALPGRPVRLLWTRADELSLAPFGPAMVVDLQADLDAQGRITRWQHDVRSPGHSRRPGRSATPALLGAWEVGDAAAVPPSIDMPLATGGGAERNAAPGYDFPAVQVRCHSVSTRRRSSALRGLGAYANVFAAESFIDEIAHATGTDPLDLRRLHLQHDPRALAVLEQAAAQAGWTGEARLQRAEGAGLGLAVARYKGTGAWCAVVADVFAGATLQVRRLTIAVDVGLAVNPDGVRNQIEGGAIQATSWTLKESAAPAHASWAEYPILRFAEVPRVDVLLMPSDAPSLGAGEAAIGPTAAAIANALFDALGVRVRDLPLSPENIVAAMSTKD